MADKRYWTMRAANELPPCDVQVAIRVPADTPERADALVERLAGKPGIIVGRVTRSAVMRECLLAGLAELERQHGRGGKRARREK